jgi:DNA processing protein
LAATLFSRTDATTPFANALDASLELGAYEEMWTERNASFKTIAEKFATVEDGRPSNFVPEELARAAGRRVVDKLRDRVRGWFNLRLRGELEYPEKLRDASHPVELLYFQGWWDIIYSRSVAVVGTRKPSEEGIRRTSQLVKRLLEDDFTIVSGLAEGIDTAAHETAIKEGGQTIAVIGTPLGHVYPKSNEILQRRIAHEFLLISQVPVERYEAQTPHFNRLFFPERNKTMSALTEATIIVEAGETSGTLIQAREALKQGRRLFILNNCFENPALTWPSKFEAMGAVRVRDYDDIRRELVYDPSRNH